MIDAAIQSEMDALCRAVAPELSDRPLYLLDHPTHLPTPKNCGAYTPQTTDVLLRDELESRGVWQGPGTTIVFVHSPRDMGTFLHELAHNLPVHSILDVTPSGELRAEHLAQTTAWAASDDTISGLPHWAPWHGRAFVRICVHLLFRATWHKRLRLAPSDLSFAGGFYHLSSAYDYVRALGEEPGDMLDATFAEILATAAPAAFTDLFSSDLKRFDEMETK